MRLTRRAAFEVTARQLEERAGQHARVDRVEEVVEGHAEESEARVRRAPSHERAVQGGAEGALARAGRAVDDDRDGAPGGGHDAREWECADTRVADKVSRKLDGFSEAT